MSGRVVDARRLLAAAFNGSDASGVNPGLIGALAESTEWLRAGLPDLHHEVFNAVADDGVVIVYGAFTGTHTASLPPVPGLVPYVVPATGNEIVLKHAFVFTFDDMGRIVGAKLLLDLVKTFRKLGVRLTASPETVGTPSLA